MTDVPGRLSSALTGRYAIERELGEGGMATVYVAHDVRHDRKVALKVLRPELAAVVGAERFLAEIRTTANLQHSHILPLFDSGEAGGFLFYVMPYVEGETVRERLDREKQLPIGDAVRITAEVGAALDYAHRHGVIHRDIKPENILLHDGQALVADFGIALAVSSAGASRMTETGLSVGTTHYMSPEQAMGEREIDGRADVYALGCVLYEMLTGEPPFTGATPQAVVAKVLTEKPTAPSVIRDTTPQAVETAVLTALAKLPADRFETADDFVAALPTIDRRTARATTLRTPVPAGPAVAVPWRRASAGLGVLALVLVGVAAWALTRDTGPAAPRVYDVALPEGATMNFTGQTSSLAYGAPFRNLALSPDGAFAVYMVREGESTALWRRSLRDATAAPIPGTAGGSMPRISPDGSQVAFFQGRSIMVVPLAGGRPRRLVDFDGLPAGLEWLAPTRLMALELEGYRFREIDTEAGERTSRPIPRCLSGHWVPDEERLVCSYAGAGRIVDPATGEMWELRSGEAGGSAAGPIAGSAFRIVAGQYLVYTSPEGDLRAAPYDRNTHRAGRSVTLLTGVRVESIGSAQYDVNAAGTLVYAPGGNARSGRLVRLDSVGTPEPLPVEPGLYQRWDLSRDGRWLATVTQGPGHEELRIHDLRNGQSFTWLRDESIGQPLWSPDGSWLVVRAANTSGAAILRGSPSSGSAPDTVFRAATREEIPDPIDLRTPHDMLAMMGGSPAHAVRLDPLARPVQVDTLARRGLFAMASPDGRHLVISVSEGNRIVMTSATPGSRERQIAADAVEPLWLSSSEILYRSGVTWYLVRIDPGTGELMGTATEWGRAPRFSDTFGWSNRPSWDGGIIYLQGPEATGAGHLRVIPRWVEEMRAAVDAANR